MSELAVPAVRKALADRNDTGPMGAEKAAKKPAIEDVYVKKTHLEQILLRPDTYIGSVEKLTQTMCVFDEGLGFRTREVTFVPGLFKIFDEILGACE
jgi:DNA topoisomerase-2